MSKDIKTNAIRSLEKAGLPFRTIYLDGAEGMSGEEVANANGEPVDQAFKTLVTLGKSREHYVFVIPVAAELDLKKAAKAAGEKNVEMIKQKELLPLTGYIHGGCSPIGMKKFFRTFVDETAELFDKIYVSGGMVGLQIEISPADLEKIIRIDYEDLTV